MKDKALIPILIVILCIGLGAILWISQTFESLPPKGQTVQQAGPTVGGPFTLVDHNGLTVTDIEFSNRYKLIFFGFTHCPGICPTELNKMTPILNELEDTGETIQPLFITTDPERDTPDVMREYVVQFHPRLIGLTGSRQQIDEVKDAYKVYAAKVEIPNAENGEYMMDHSTFMYLMSPENELVLVFNMDETPESISAEIREAI